MDSLIIILIIFILIANFAILYFVFTKAPKKEENSVENFKDPEQVEKAINEDIDKIKVLNK